MNFSKDNYIFGPYLPIEWEPHENELPVFSLSRTHGLKVKIRLNHSSDKVNQNRDIQDHTLISYEVNERRYDLFTYKDLGHASYALDDTGVTNMIGDLAERIARRLMKRFLQVSHRKIGKLGGLFDKRFNPKMRSNFIVASSQSYVLKIGRYPNMLLLKKTGQGHWGFQHITDLDGLFDYRVGKERHLIILESKSGKIDQNPDLLYQKTFAPMRELFPEAHFSYVLFATRPYLFSSKYPEYRILKKTPERIYRSLLNHGIPSMFFHFREKERDFHEMARHLIQSYRSYHAQTFKVSGETEITPSQVRVFQKGSASPFLELTRDPVTGYFKVSKTSYLPYKNG
ncbi:MAG: hypothetical protein CSA81_08290 [Acidobacteria bacterium]|nr:MAG: hypothetical protein CSA81_08290 [Acidobacteriota bacterium]PIE89723.1 MAG: hypothetical protein CR997_09825 [Acidobacteriota bacterium]